MVFNLNHFPDNMIHVYGFYSVDAGVVRVNVVLKVDTTLCHGRLIWMFHTDMALMLLQPDVN
jgi:hypothetical protein